MCLCGAALHVKWPKKAFLRGTPSWRSTSHSADGQTESRTHKDKESCASLKTRSLLWSSAVNTFSCFYTGKWFNDGISLMLILQKLHFCEIIVMLFVCNSGIEVCQNKTKKTREPETFPHSHLYYKHIWDSRMWKKELHSHVTQPISKNECIWDTQMFWRFEL